MDMILQREALLKPLQAVSGIVEKKQLAPHSPVLSHVLISMKNDRLCLTGTDLDIELIGLVNVENIAAFTPITVSARKLFDICRALPEGALLNLSLENNHLVVKTPESCFMLNALSGKSFPYLEEASYPVQFTIKQGQLKNLLIRTHFAMGQQDVRQYLNGVFLDIRPGVIKSVAADGHRLALTTVQDDQIGEAEARIILPRKSVLELIRLFANDSEQDVNVRLNEHRFQLITEDFIFTTKLINAQYPDYNRLIPHGKLTAVGDTEAIKQALTRASILSNEKFRGVRFQLEPNKLCITANNSDQEQAKEALSLHYEGQAMEITFNVAYLLDVVSAIINAAKCKNMRFSFTDSNSGVLLAPVEEEHSLYVVMPLRL
jgi:DNA polymerase-3 subunit beta